MLTKFVKPLLYKLNFRFYNRPLEEYVVMWSNMNSGITFVGVIDLGFSLLLYRFHTL